MRVATLLRETLTFILAGGQAEQLYPLTKDRAKPAVPFGGQYRLIDFTLSNCVNSGITRIYVLTQYRSYSLDTHLKLGWNIFAGQMGDFLLTVPPQLRMGTNWYQGSADAIFQNIYILQQHRPAFSLILSGDHIYKMDYSRLIEAHVRTGAVLSVACVECSRALAANRMGVVEVDGENRIVDFQEKPEDPKPIPGRPDVCLVSMGVYVFDTAALVQGVSEDARRDSTHGLGQDVLPSLVRGGRVYAYRFEDDNHKEVQYWRDIGTVDSYYEASMDLVQVNPVFNLYDASFSLHSLMEPHPPAKVTSGAEGYALDSLLCNGCVVGGHVERSILSPGVRIEPGAFVQDSILFDRVEIGAGAKVRGAIIDKEVRIPPGFCTGYDSDADGRQFSLTPSGIVVIPKRHRIE
jgi:glucose-1-phosphate adenylyltransferase